MAEDKKYWTFGEILANISDDDVDVYNIKNFKERMECYEIAIRIGVLSRDEARQLERLPEYTLPREKS